MNQIPSNARFLFQNSDSPQGQESSAAETTPWVTDRANRHAFLFRFLALNMGAFALLAAAWGQGWLQLVIEADSIGLTFIIVAVFATGFILCGQRVWWLNGELALLAGAEATPGSLATDYLAKTAGHDASSRQLSASALLLFLGTLLGTKSSRLNSSASVHRSILANLFAARTESRWILVPKRRSGVSGSSPGAC